MPYVGYTSTPGFLILPLTSGEMCTKYTAVVVEVRYREYSGKKNTAWLYKKNKEVRDAAQTDRRGTNY